MFVQLLLLSTYHLFLCSLITSANTWIGHSPCSKGKLNSLAQNHGLYIHDGTDHQYLQVNESGSDYPDCFTTRHLTHHYGITFINFGLWYLKPTFTSLQIYHTYLLDLITCGIPCLNFQLMTHTQWLCWWFGRWWINWMCAANSWQTVFSRSVHGCGIGGGSLLDGKLKWKRAWVQDFTVIRRVSLFSCCIRCFSLRLGVLILTRSLGLASMMQELGQPLSTSAFLKMTCLSSDMNGVVTYTYQGAKYELCASESIRWACFGFLVFHACWILNWLSHIAFRLPFSDINSG